MAEKEDRLQLARKIITLVLLLGISGTFMAFYYLIYLPQQQDTFNQRIFRVLHEMSENFSMRAENYGKVSTNSYVNKTIFDQSIPFNKLYDGNFDSTLQKSFTVKLNEVAKFYSNPPFFKDDSIYFEIVDARKPGDSTIVGSSKKALSDILKPLISVHANVFESILLVKLVPDTAKNKAGNKKYDNILYKSSELGIANISADSLFSDRKIQAAAMNEINIEGTKYKMFLLPFQMKILPNETFVLSGLISKSNYSKQSQYIPIDFLITIVFLLRT